MLDEQQPDSVFVIGPAHQIRLPIMRRGIDLRRETLGNTSAQARELAELAEANGVWGHCGFMKRFATSAWPGHHDAPGVRRVLWCHPRGQGPYHRWGIDSARRAMLIGQLCHIFDLTRFLGGDVAAVMHSIAVTSTQFAIW